MAGARNKLQAKVFESLLKEWEGYGDEVLRIVRMEKPDVWLKVVASILPRELLVTEDRLSQLSDEEVAEYLAAITINPPKLINDRSKNH